MILSIRNPEHRAKFLEFMEARLDSKVGVTLDASLAPDQFRYTPTTVFLSPAMHRRFIAWADERGIHDNASN